MKIRVLIGLLLVLVLSVSQVSGQCSSSETACCSASPQKAAACTASADAKPGACCSDAANAKQAACPGTATAKLASATPGCPLQTAGIELCTKQQAKVQAILAQARKDVLAVLTADQKVKFAKIPLMALVFGQTVGPKASFATNVAASTESCCATKTVAQTTCTPDCQKACCATQTVAQTTCPIMKGSPIKKSVFTVYQGKKVYFCCPGCDKAFNKNPEKYTKNLPQFK